MCIEKASNCCRKTEKRHPSKFIFFILFPTGKPTTIRSNIQTESRGSTQRRNNQQKMLLTKQVNRQTNQQTSQQLNNFN